MGKKEKSHSEKQNGKFEIQIILVILLYFIFPKKSTTFFKRRSENMKYKDLREQKINCFEYLDQLIRKGYITVLEAMAGEKL